MGKSTPSHSDNKEKEMVDFEVFIQKSALDDAEALIGEAALHKKEALGFLLGSAYTWKGKTYAVADEFITAQSDSTAVSVRFGRQAFSELARQLRSRGSGKIIVGWCHSHLGYGCFLSGTDVATQSKYFGEPHGFALVIDVLIEEKGGMQRRAFKVRGREYYEVPFAVIEKK